MISYLLIRILTFPLMFFPYSWIHKLGNGLGICAFYLLPKFRKRALSNLALASDLHLSEADILRYAKESFQNLMITCLEYAKFYAERDIHRIATCENPETASDLIRKGTGIIFFCGHQANWEILFLEGTSRMPGVAIGRPTKNHHLYQWILAIRQKFGGKIITPKNAAKEGFRALKKGSFLGIVGDQGMPDSGFSSNFFGRRAWTSPLPALLSFRSGCPIMVATTVRKYGKYFIHYSDPFYPDQQANTEEEIRHLMEKSLKILESSIKEHPGQWMWQHNRWKQQTLVKLKKRWRQDAIGIILPQDPALFNTVASHLSIFREIYPTEFILLYVPEKDLGKCTLADAEIKSYLKIEDLLINDYRLKLIFDFVNDSRIRKHYYHLSAFDILTLNDLKRISGIDDVQDLPKILTTALYNA